MTNNSSDAWIAINIADIATVLDEINSMLTEAAMKNGMLSQEPIHLASADAERGYTIADSTGLLLDKIWNAFYLVQAVLAESKLIDSKEW